MAYAANKIIEWGAPIWLVLLANGITVFNPVIQTYAVTTAKDSLFAVFFILTVTLLIEMLRTPEALASVPFATKWVLSVLGMCLMRKQGVYVAIIVMLIGSGADD